MVSKKDVLEASKRIRDYIAPTPLTHSPLLSELTGYEVWCKWDNKLRTGSFKERGALNTLLQLSKKERKKGVCAASAGNHALAVSYYAGKLDIPCTLIMPKTAPVVKVSRSIEYGAEVILHGDTFHEAQDYVLQLSKNRSLPIIHAFDDPRVIAGQGTSALEVLNERQDFDCFIVPIGGGGYISGTGLALDGKFPLFGVRSEWAVNAQLKEVADPKRMLMPTSIADGIAVKTKGILTEKLIKKLVDKTFIASEADIANAIITLLELERTLVEGAGSASLVPLLTKSLPKKIKRVCLFICGSNIDISALQRLISRDLGLKNRLVTIKVSVPDRPGSLAKVAALIAENGASIMETMHDRVYCDIPGNTNISFLVEVRDSNHARKIKERLESRFVSAVISDGRS